jgi:hypothetical protein
MAATRESLFKKTDLLYMGVFALGMLTFWLGGHAAQYVPKGTPVILRLVVIAGIYGLVIFGATYLSTKRSLVAAIAAAVTGIALSLITAQFITQLAAGKLHNHFDLAVLTFVLYLVYGTIYALALLIGRTIAKRRLA